MLKMKEETPSRMVLKESSFLGVVVGLLFFAVGLVLYFTPGAFTEAPPSWAGLIIAPIGIIVALLVDIEKKAILDKGTGRMVLSTRNLISVKPKEHDIADIVEIELGESYETRGTGDDRSTRLVHKIFAIMKDKNRILITQSSGTTGLLVDVLRKGSPEKDLAQKIADFIGVPMKERRPPSVDEMMSMMQKKMDEGMRKYKRG